MDSDACSVDVFVVVGGGGGGGVVNQVCPWISNVLCSEFVSTLWTPPSIRKCHSRSGRRNAWYDRRHMQSILLFSFLSFFRCCFCCIWLCTVTPFEAMPASRRLSEWKDGCDSLLRSNQLPLHSILSSPGNSLPSASTGERLWSGAAALSCSEGHECTRSPHPVPISTIRHGTGTARRRFIFIFIFVFGVCQQRQPCNGAPFTWAAVVVTVKIKVGVEIAVTFEVALHRARASEDSS